ncbi:hypothetical protein [Arsenicicoccus dermatophilus]|uniref:hypothetical protein n=1 Tax=Arsenicicoccus dermatophilus TaxID=1076331 RepID=UPI003916D354
MPVLPPTSAALARAVDELDWTTATMAASPVVQHELVSCLQLLADRLEALGQDPTGQDPGPGGSAVWWSTAAPVDLQRAGPAR